VVLVNVWVLFSEFTKENPVQTKITTLCCSLAAVTAAMVFGSHRAEAGGYFYRARSLYVMPPSYAYLSVIGQPPIVVYEPVVTYPAPVAGYYEPVAAPVAAPVMAPAPAPVVGYTAGYAAPAPVAAYAARVGVGRVRERQVSTPFTNRYRYHVDNPYGPNYTYRTRETPGTVRFTERWSR
jgi:hypothetical protein